MSNIEKKEKNLNELINKLNKLTCMNKKNVWHKINIQVCKTVFTQTESR